MHCGICGSASGQEHLVREMMFGSRDEFRYFECAACGCLQLCNPPPNMADYYPPDRYYSFNDDPAALPAESPWRRWIKRRRDAAILFQQSGLFRRLAARRPNPGISDVARWLQPTGVRSFDCPILDVGCGNGQLLTRFARLGFRDLTGVDPYLSSDRHSAGVSVQAAPIEAMIGRKFDLVMFHHALEHMPEQVRVLEIVRQLLTARGCCLIRIPIVSEGPWKRYGTDWAEIDAPRHFFLHTESSLQIAATAAGMRILDTQYEAEPFAYAASELYQRGIPLYDSEQQARRDWWDMYSSQEAEAFERIAEENNVPGRAARAAFFLGPA